MVSLMEWAARRLAIVAVATAAVALPTGVVVGRYTAPTGNTPQHVDAASTPSPTASVAPSPAAATTVVPSPTSDGADRTSATTGSLPGAPTRVNEFGIPVGYPHTQAGAISACGNYVMAYSDVRNREPTRIKAIFASIAIPSVAGKYAQQIIDIDQKNSGDYGVNSVNDPQVNFNSRVPGYKVNGSSSNTVTISVWSTTSFGVYGSQDLSLQPQTRWGTDVCTVQWTDGDWKLADAGDGTGGPLMTDRAAGSFQHFAFVGGSSSS